MEARREFDFIRNPHPHPLIFYREGRPNDGEGGEEEEILCSICAEPFSPPGFGCSRYGCKFNVHQLCIKLPKQIPNPFSYDPQIPSLLFEHTTTNSSPCNLCAQQPYGHTYHYRFGGYLLLLDLQCAITFDPEANSLLNTTTAYGRELIRHFTHPHPLTLHEPTHHIRKILTIPVCIICQAPIQSSSTYYYCPQSQPNCHSYTFHKKCAELPRQILNPDIHPHPLFLFALSWQHQPVCLNCNSECKNFFYSCPLCCYNMNLHVYCVPSFKHQHDFQIFRRKLPTYECQLCRRSANNDFPWFCTICHQVAHKKCAIFQMSQHLRDRFSIQLSSNLINTIDQNRISHFSHKQHMLSLCEPKPCPGEYSHNCDGCMRRISTDLSQFFACQPCGFYLHRDCAALKTQIDNLVLHPHELSMVYIPDFVFSCAVCFQYSHGFAYHCKECYFVIDIRCATAFTFPFTHLSHHHPLSDSYEEEEEHKCKACGEWLNFKNTYGEWMNYKIAVGCKDCKFYLDLRCAHLPLAVRNRFDEHPLILTFANVPLPARKRFYKECVALVNSEAIDWVEISNKCYSDYSLIFEIEKEENDDLEEEEEREEKNEIEEKKEEEKNEIEETEKYYCDICEEERKEKEWFYYCWLCDFAAHPRCVLGEFPFLKSIKFEGHPHPLSWVLKTNESIDCSACEKMYDGNLAFECRRCKDFNVHAFGQCYHQQLTQARFTYVMPPLRYRSIPLCQDLHEIMWNNLCSFFQSMEGKAGSFFRLHNSTTKVPISNACLTLDKCYLFYQQQKSNTQ